MKKILCITGTRADFGKMKPLLNHLEQSPLFELHLLVTGMHMLKIYGSTHLEVRKVGYKNCYLVSNQSQGEAMSAVLGNTITLLSRLNDEIEPDLILVHGDRIEALAGTIVGALSNRLVCHIEGGELSGTIDDAIRHAISKMAHIHLVANEEAQNRLLQMGEQATHIHIIGSPDLDVMRSDKLPELSAVKQHYGIDFDDYIISMFHPVTTEVAQIADYTAQYFQALKRSGENVVAIYPNNDLGNDAIIRELQTIQQSNNPRFKIFPSIRFEAFLTLLKHAKMMTGNSSAGIREAPFYGVPSVDVGTRQSNRHRAASIIHCDYHTEAVLSAVKQANQASFRQPDAAFAAQQSDSTTLFAQLLQSPNFWQTPIQKTFCDLTL
ncbi:MAG: UDP-N-acetylglucosamine 2-epimerase [Alysiella sp.]|uniref:UDP-N-acetylglucosamine 2-epimerase n=1 Tax=Alysiella sp. TaxID=1872483 RepID=UPI0026DD1FC6|nr:UDP-N-acetylglucosamine 2-epimerase [Alysiella sp.]MDO4433336.1 UDP-N-acetylglucosamine 2-epimerase [Alysiella sp.]